MKFIVGEAKKKYGLTVPAQAVKQPALAAFGTDDDDDDNNNDDGGDAVAAQRRMGTTSTMNRIAAAHTAEALAQDASVFDYDGVFDELKAKQKQATRAARKDANREPKYIKQLLAKAEERKRDDELYYEKKLLREQADEAAEFGTTDKFVTSAYRQKMEQNRLWREEKERRDAEIEARSVAASGSTALLANILNNRLADQDDDNDDDADVKGAAVLPVSNALPQKRPAADGGDLAPPSDVAAATNASTSDATRGAAPPPPVVVERRTTQGWSADVVPDKPLVERQKEALVVESRHDESSIVSAKDRYLARKRQRTAEQQLPPP